jgi:hypothetical protein
VSDKFFRGFSTCPMIVTRRNITIAYDPVLAVFEPCGEKWVLKEIPSRLENVPATSADLQRGERYAIMDLIFQLSFPAHVSSYNFSSYDLRCQSACRCECHKVSFFFQMWPIFF